MMFRRTLGDPPVVVQAQQQQQPNGADCQALCASVPAGGAQNQCMLACDRLNSATPPPAVHAAASFGVLQALRRLTGQQQTPNTPGGIPVPTVTFDPNATLTVDSTPWYTNTYVLIGAAVLGFFAWRHYHPKKAAA